MIQSALAFENLFNQKFSNLIGNLNRTTLGSVIENKERFELGGEETGITRIRKALDRSNQILQYCFDKHSIWSRIVFWDRDGEINLINAGLDVKGSDHSFRYKQQEDVLYLHFKKYSSFKTNPIVTSIINYDLGEEPYANITCYFIDFNRSIIINIYDDRGMDVYSPDQRFIKNLLEEFSDWSLK